MGGFRTRLRIKPFFDLFGGNCPAAGIEPDANDAFDGQESVLRIECGKQLSAQRLRQQGAVGQGGGAHRPTLQPAFWYSSSETSTGSSASGSAAALRSA